MTILKQFLHFLDLLDQLVEFGEWLSARRGVAIAGCLISYQLLVGSGYDALSAIALASTFALALHCLLHNPEF